MADSKDTIYVDIDDEITALIDKVRGSSARVVALVLPKRASVLQSVVNMKLLKRTADNEKKNIVLITTESGLLPLAGAVGLHVATNLNSKPEIPAAPMMAASGPEMVDEDMALDDEETPDYAAAAGASIGALADAASRSGTAPSKANDSLETVELDNEDNALPAEAAAAPLAAEGAKKAAKNKKDKHLKVPNFDRFRLLIIGGVLLLIALIVLGIFAFSVWPHAIINIKTDASTVNTNANLTLDPQAQSADVTTGDIPAKQVSQQKTFTQTVNTTGQKNEGTPASGTVKMSLNDCQGTYSSNTNDLPSFTIPAGTGISYNNSTYITQADTTMTIYKFSGSCAEYIPNGSTPIDAQQGGSQYNTQISNATVSNFPEVTASGSASGGTDNIVQIVSQNDITSATSKINATDSSTVKQALINELKGEGLYPVDVTFTSGSPQISNNPSVGTASNTVTVTETITYTMFGASMSDLQAVLASNIHSQTSKNQNIISYGINEYAFKQAGSSGSTDQVSLSTLATVGPNISVSAIKKQAAGKSPQAIIAAIKGNPDVTSVTVRLNPFWVSQAPSNLSKITVKIAKPGKSA